MTGFVKLHRCILNKAIWKNHNLFRVFAWCLMKANWQEQYEEMVGMTKVVLTPGQFVFGRYKAAKELGLKPSTLVDCLKWLKTNTTIDIKSNNKFSVVTVINWGLYQSGEDCSDTSPDTKSDNTPTTSRQQPDTNKNTKNNKKFKKLSLPELPSDALDLADYLKEKILEWKPNAKIPDDLKSWANTFRLMMKQDKRNPDDIAKLIEWATKDDFWQANILSADAIRRGYDKIEAKMMQKKKVTY